MKCGNAGDCTKAFTERWYSFAGKRWKCVITRDKSADSAPKEGKKQREDDRFWGEKLKNNIRRSIRTVEELAACNPWEWWITLTLDEAKQNRYDIDEYKKSLAQWLRDQRKKKVQNLRYLLIPEQHKDGAWHMHGFITGLLADDLRKDWQSEFATLPKYIRESLAAGNELYWWPEYLKRFGYCTIEPIRSQAACASYCTKYMKKAIDGNMIQSGKSLYLASQGLQRAERVERGEVPEDAIMISGYLWECGAAYWFERLAPETRVGELIDYSERKH
jgi:hypothetical protein